MKHHVLIMGVSGSGKSTIGKRLAETLHLPFIEADDFHSEANKEKMKKGVPLNDTDRAGWLATLADEVKKHDHTGFVLSCSALKKSYRQQISAKLSQSLRIFHLKGDKQVIAGRMHKRKHYMPVSLLDSQFEILEYSNDMYEIDIGCSEEEIVAQIIDELNLKKSALGIIGLGVMGKSLARNFASKGIPVTVFNLPLKGEENIVNDFVKTFGDINISGAENLTDLLRQLEHPKIVLLMVKSGEPVDQLIQSLKKELRRGGDIIIDAGNSFFKDSIRRYQELQEAGIEFVGMGVSGGEEGALLGPSLMPSGSALAKERLMPLLQKISAKADGKDCISWSGKDGAGHFMKMVHNGIEYADMQIIAECYSIAKHDMNMSNESIATMFENWNNTLAGSYLLEISADILRHKENNKSLVDEILDVAESKGTGLWALQEALNLQVPMPCLHAALNERSISGYKHLRVKLNNESDQVETSGKLSKENLLGSMIFSRLAALAEGMHLISVASKHYDWNINLAALTQSWRGGCIIRSNLLLQVIEAFKEDSQIEQLFQSKTITSLLNQYKADTSQVISNLSQSNISIPLISAAFSYYKSMHTKYLPLNLIQAQRDYFGAHTYRRPDSEGQSFHTDWRK